MGVCTVTVLSEGKAIDPAYGLLSLQVTAEVNRIPYAELVLSDGDAATRKFAISDTAVFEPGKEIEIKLRYEGQPGKEKTVFKGLVVAQEVNVEDLSSTLTVVLKDAAMAMTKGKNHRVFNNISDSDIIKKLLNLHGLKVNGIVDTQIKHKEMVQHACSDWDFIVTRAESNGLLVSVQNGSVSVKSIKSPTASKAGFEYGVDEIYSFSIEANGESQYAEISGNAWDFQQQSGMAIKKSGNLGLTPGNLNSGSLADKLGGKNYTLATSAALVNRELTAWAEGKLARSQLSLIRGRLAITGRGDLELLDTIEIKGIGDRFNGKAIVTGIGQRVTAGKWITDIQFGLADQWLLHSHGVNSLPASGLLPAISGLQMGMVKDIGEDPDKELRIKINLLPLNQDTPYTLWARLACPDAGKERGYFFRPEPGDEVVVGFVDDDPRQAIVLGALYSSKNVSPKRFGKADDKNYGKGMASKKGMVIGFDDEKTIVYIETPGKNSITLDDDGKKIELKDQHGNSILMDQNGITLKSAKDFKLEASGNMEIKGAKVDIK